MISLKTLVYESTPIDYDGTQLSPHWIFKRCDLLGDAVVAFLGKANVDIAHMVDLSDVKANAPIYSPRMLHFVGEWFIDSLDRAILLQHLFAGEIYELLLEQGIGSLTRKGNDIFFKSRKVSVSIATKSPLSTLMHTGINIETEGTPVPTAGLKELGIEPFDFAERVLRRFSADWEGWEKARRKVIPRL